MVCLAKMSSEISASREKGKAQKNTDGGQSLHSLESVSGHHPRLPHAENQTLGERYRGTRENPSFSVVETKSIFGAYMVYWSMGYTGVYGEYI